MTKPVLFVVVVACLVGCSPKYYSPNTQNVPLLSEKNQINLSVIGNGNQAEFQAAYAFGDGFAMQANGGIFNPKDLENGDGGSGRFLELGAGYYRPLSGNFVFEVYGLGGMGRVENNLRSRATTNPVTNGNISADLVRVGVQPNFGLKTEHFTVAISSRLMSLQYSDIHGDLVYDGVSQQTYLRENSSNLLLEPALTLRGGFQRVKFQLQIGRSFNLNNPDFRQDDTYATLGLNFNFTD